MASLPILRPMAKMNSDRSGVQSSPVLLAGIGLVGGSISGLVGVGGGIVMIPLMVGLLGMSQHRAHGTSLAIIVPTALAATIRYATANPIDWTLVVALAATSVGFATVGARLTAHINPTMLRRLFALLLLVTALRMIFSIQDVALLQLDGGQRVLAALVTGVVTGLVSGAMGVGGGIVMVPAMVILMGFEQVDAQGISLAVIVPTALSGAFQLFRMGHVDRRRALTIGVGGIAGGVAGAQVAQSLPAPVLRGIFAVFVLFSSPRMFGVQGWIRRWLTSVRGSHDD